MNGHMPPPPPGGHHGHHGHPGGRPAWGPGFKFWGPIPKAPGGTVSSTGDYFSGRSAKTYVDFYCNSKIVKHNTGSSTKAFISSIRLYSMGPLHHNIFGSRIAAADADLSENRITAEQAMYRKLKAAAKYYSYLYKVGLHTKATFVYELRNYAKDIGAYNDNWYIFEQVIEENGISLEDLQEILDAENEQRVSR